MQNTSDTGHLAPVDAAEIHSLTRPDDKLLTLFIIYAALTTVFFPIAMLPSYLRLRIFYWKLYATLWAGGIVAAGIALYLYDTRLLLLVLPLALVAAAKAAILYVVSRLDYEMRWYVITERSLLIREGVWNVREITLTFANAQNVRVTQGPIERLFGFSNVEVDTAGGGGAGGNQGTDHRESAVLRGLANPAEVRDIILDLLRQHRTAGLGDPDDPEDGASESIDRKMLDEILEEAKGMRRALAG